MPSFPDLDLGDIFDRYAYDGVRTDDVSKLESLKRSFNSIHQWTRKSMDLNKTFINRIVSKLEIAIEEFENHSEPFDHTDIFENLHQDVVAYHAEFYMPYLQAEIEVTNEIANIYRAIYPYEAQSYSHHILDRDKDKVNEMIATHLYRQGLFDIGDEFINEAGDGELRDKMSGVKSQFKNLQEIINAVISREVELPLKWISDNREEMGEIKASELEFKIHVLKYVRMVQDSGSQIPMKLEAINYARAHLSRFSNNHMTEITKLLGLLVFPSDKISMVDNYRYRPFLSNAYERKVIAELEGQFCSLIGQCSSNPLISVTSVGAKVLSGVCKAARFVKEDLGCDWAELQELPLYVDLEDEFKFHSQFFCPLTNAVIPTKLNPPMALSCGHVFTLQTILYVAYEASDWKSICPFCKAVTTSSQYKTVHF